MARDGAQIIELRVDCLDDIGAVERLLGAPHPCDSAGAPIPYIITIRSADEGGMFDGEDADRVALIERLGLLQPGYIDVELAVWRRSANLRQKIGLVCDIGSPQALGAHDRPRNRLILSHHDWRATPHDLSGVFDALTQTPGAIGKAAYRCADATDALRILAELHSRRDFPLIAIGMDEAGVATRLLAPKFGAFLSFAARGQSESSAPGQLTVARMCDEFRWNDVQPSTAVYGVVGWPVGHSRSPLIHNAALAAANIDAIYLPFPVKPTHDDFAAFMDRADEATWLDLRGLSVTIPHKEHARRWLHAHGGEITARAERAGAVNTLTRRGSNWLGDNTDGLGAVAALRALPAIASSGLRGWDIAILGSGGAARGVAAALLDEGAAVRIYNRDPARGAELAATLGCTAHAWEGRTQHGAQIVVNCTALGMPPYDAESPLPAAAHRADVIVFDTVYTPPQTRLLREARTAGCAVVSGVDMFVGQAAAQFEQWHQRPAPLQLFRTVLDRGMSALDIAARTDSSASA